MTAAPRAALRAGASARRCAPGCCRPRDTLRSHPEAGEAAEDAGSQGVSAVAVAAPFACRTRAV